MPTVNNRYHPSDETSFPDNSHRHLQVYRKEQSTTGTPKLRHTNTQQSKSRSAAAAATARPPHDYTSPHAKHTVERDSSTQQSESRSTATKARLPRAKHTGERESKGATEDASARGSAPHHPYARRSQDARGPPGHHHSGDEHHIMPEGSGGPPPEDKYRIKYHQTRDELKQARTTIENYDRELRKEREMRHAAGPSQITDNLHDVHLQDENQRTISSLQNELINVHQQLDDAKKLSEVREKEFVGSQVFLAKADTLSISEVGEKVTALNEEIFQAAATLGDALVYERREVSQTDLDAAAAVSKEIVGKKMAKLLFALSQKPEPEVNPLLVQVVLQIFMVKFCVSKIQSWYPGDSVIGDFLSAIYSQIRSNEEQAISGRWRALTRAHTRPSSDTWNEELYQKLQSLLMIASWAPDSPKNLKSYGNRLPSIFKSINELRLAIGEKITSADLDIFVFECDHIYDPAFMEDAYGDGRQSSGIKRAPEAIVGTTGIGLAKFMAERSAKDHASQFRSLIPAKIVLRSTLKEVLEPTQSTRFKKNKLVETVDGANQDGRD